MKKQTRQEKDSELFTLIMIEIIILVLFIALVIFGCTTDNWNGQ